MFINLPDSANVHLNPGEVDPHYFHPQPDE